MMSGTMGESAITYNQTAVVSYNSLECSCCLNILVAPTTLVCGHTVCRLCLAKWFMSSRQKTCPICRKVWDVLPNINIVLRDLVNELIGVSMLQRYRETYNYRNKLTLQKFEKLQRIRGEQSLWGELVVRAIVLLSLCWFVYGFAKSNHNLERPLYMWNTADVVHWLQNQGSWTFPYRLTVHEKNIDGYGLLLANQTELDELLNIKHSTHSEALHQSLERTKILGEHSPNDILHFKALYPRMTATLYCGFLFFPRATLLYAYQKEYKWIFLPMLHTMMGSVDDISFDKISKGELPQPGKDRLFNFFYIYLGNPFWVLFRCFKHCWELDSYVTAFTLIICVVKSLTEILTFILAIRDRAIIKSTIEHLQFPVQILVLAGIIRIMPPFISSVVFNSCVYVIPFLFVKNLANQIRQIRL